MIFTIFFQSCDKDTEPGGTAVQDMSGDWWVTYQNSVDENSFIFDGKGSMPSLNTVETSWKWDFIYSDSHSRLMTYNTASNSSDTIFINNNGNDQWNYKVKVLVDYNNKTFQRDSTANLAKKEGLKVVGGKILKGAAKSPSGMSVDSIVFYIRFYDDKYGFTYTKVSGFRRTGFPKDDF